MKRVKFVGLDVHAETIGKSCRPLMSWPTHLRLRPQCVILSCRKCEDRTKNSRAA